MKIITQIKVTSANLMQVFKLPCVSSVTKKAKTTYMAISKLPYRSDLT